MLHWLSIYVYIHIPVGAKESDFIVGGHITRVGGSHTDKHLDQLVGYLCTCRYVCMYVCMYVCPSVRLSLYVCTMNAESLPLHVYLPCGLRVAINGPRC